MIDQKHGWNVSFKPLFLGYILSLIALFGAYRVDQYHLSDGFLTFILFVIAITQAILQLVFFFHIGLGSKPRWNIVSLFFAIFVLFLVIGGSMWIMYNLDYNLMMSDHH